MTIPKRHPAAAAGGTYLVTTSTWGRRAIFRAEPWAKLLIETIYEHRKKGHFLLHAFAVMPEHLHLLLTVEAEPGLQKAVQYIKGGYSFSAGKEFASKLEIWQKGFDDQWIGSEQHFLEAKHYVEKNPVAAKLVERAEEYQFCSAAPGFELDPAPVFRG